MKQQTPKKFGNVIRQMYQGDQIILSIDGEQIGYVELLRVPHDQKVKIAFAFAQSVKIDRPKETPSNA